ncbi:glycosyltransferase family 2 protein [Aeromonas hydrophila]|uniref:glycosyltransferase family 2 protein n=1 Tax=Aeromonas hydrophila TaxID=644 RepID=UPI003D258827
MNADIKVSVCVVTYNQEKYIAQCLQSLVEQVTDFDFEIIVGDDYSSDKTRDIIRKFSIKYSNIIENFHPKNIGTVKNILSTYKMAKGKYICHLDGDDYALPGKLQSQFDALEANADCKICTHDVVVVSKDSVLVKNSFNSKETGVYNVKDIYADLPFFSHSSKMFINTYDESFGSIFTDSTLDIEVHISQLGDGNLIHLGTALGAYRIFTGVSSLNKKVNKDLVDGVDRVFGAAIKHDSLNTSFYRKCYAISFFKFSYQSALYGDKDGVGKYIRKSLSIYRFSSYQYYFYLLSYVPSVLIFLCKTRAKLKGYQF